MAKAEREILRRTKWDGSEAAHRVLAERYLLRKDGKLVETPEDMFHRVASSIAKAEVKWGSSPQAVEEVTEQFYKIMVSSRFMPNSPTLMNAGKENGLQYSACYVLPVDDSIGGIFEAVKRAAQIHQSGGGTGFSFSRLRPKDAEVKSTGGKASGPVSFLRVFNAATEAVKQGGTRRGANMGILKVDHPDILEFIHCKRVLDEDHRNIFDQMAEHVSPEIAEHLRRPLLDRQIANFNISVAVTDAFMNAVREDKEYELIAPHTGEVTAKLRARDVYDQIVSSAWETGDPGMIFVDRINAGPANPTPTLGKVEATNPCGEQPLYPNEACNLGSLNLAKFVKKDADGMDWDALRDTVQLSVRFLDDVIEVNPYPLPIIDECVKSNRRVGLGIMGWADLLMKLGIPYDSEEAVELAGKVMEFIRDVGRESSVTLAEQRGAFPNFDKSIYAGGKPLRNATVTTIAPTGTISIIAGCSSGIEPVFALAFQHVVGERRLTFVNPVFEEMAKSAGFLAPEVREEVLKHGTARGVKGIPESAQKVFVTAHEIPFEWHIRHQAAFQKYTDNGVSKTINLSNSATQNDVSRAYTNAYDLGCLGITVFRDGCKGTQVLTVGVGAPAAAGKAQKKPSSGGVKNRPEKIRGTTSMIRTPVGEVFVTINEDEKAEPLEVFVTVGKAGSDITADAEAIGRLMSFALRVEAELAPRERLRKIARQLSGIGGSRTTGLGPEKIRSLADGVATVIFKYLDEPVEKREKSEAVRTQNAPPVVYALAAAAVERDLCPKCGNATLVAEEGCAKCHSCGYSEC